jgi:glutathione S-transferase
MLAPASLRAVHPLGKSPVITDDGRVVAETGAIVEYLVDRYGNGRLIPPAGSDDRLRYTYWLHYAEGSAMPPLLLKLIFDRIPQGAPWLIRPVANRIVGAVMTRFIGPQLALHLDYMESELAGRDWFAGAAFTAADIELSFPLEAASARAGLDRSRPRLWNWLERIHARPAYQRAVQKGKMPGA